MSSEHVSDNGQLDTRLPGDCGTKSFICLRAWIAGDSDSDHTQLFNNSCEFRVSTEHPHFQGRSLKMRTI